MEIWAECGQGGGRVSAYADVRNIYYQQNLADCINELFSV